MTAGDPYLEAALLQLPDAEVYGVKPADYGASTHPESFDLIVFDATRPATLPDRPILAVAPPAPGPLGEVLGTVDGPGIGTLDPQEPLLRYVDLSTVHIAQAQKLVLPAWARMVIPGPGGVPLLYAGRRNGLPTAVLAFEPRRSDLPLQVAFPILISNLAGELLGASAAPAAAVAPGAPLSLPLPEGATGLRVTRPDGSVVEASAATTSRSVVFSGTDGLGVYTAVPVGTKVSPGVSPGASPGASPSASSAAATAPAAASPFGSTAEVTAPPVDPNAPLRFAVDLFEPAESDIAPGDAAALTALGTGASTAATSSVGSSPGASVPISAAPVAPRPPARDELWAPLLLLVLLLLLVEWTVYERDALIRLRRRLAAALVGRRLIPRLPTGRRGS